MSVLIELAILQLTSSCIQSTTTFIALEMLSFLMIDQDLQIIKIALTIVAPWPRQNFFDIWMSSLLFRHDGRL